MLHLMILRSITFGCGERCHLQEAGWQLVMQKVICNVSIHAFKLRLQLQRN